MSLKQPKKRSLRKPSCLLGAIFLLAFVTLMQSTLWMRFMTTTSYDNILMPQGQTTRNLQQKASNNHDCNNAFQQSFGFFTDIPNEHWKIAQTIHAKTFPNHFSSTLARYSSTIHDKGSIRKLQKSSFWNAENFQEEFHCAYAQRIPSTSDGDGPKWVCDPHRLKGKKDCLVYSVGSNGKVQFEQGIRDEIGAECEIHTFDLIASNRRHGSFEKALHGVGAFHHWGIGTQQQADHYEKTKKGPTMKTLKQTMEALGHTNRTVDIFKIDCEWCEWETYQDWLQQDLRQILVETHNAPMPQARDFFYQLHDAGYVIFSKEANFQNGGGGVEFAFLKLHTDFMGDNLYSSMKPQQQQEVGAAAMTASD